MRRMVIFVNRDDPPERMDEALDAALKFWAQGYKVEIREPDAKRMRPRIFRWLTQR